MTFGKWNARSRSCHSRACSVLFFLLVLTQMCPYRSSGSCLWKKESDNIWLYLTLSLLRLIVQSRSCSDGVSVLGTTSQCVSLCGGLKNVHVHSQLLSPLLLSTYCKSPTISLVSKAVTHAQPDSRQMEALRAYTTVKPNLSRILSSVSLLKK